MDANQRLQSAMEYLMTYGWAILIIAVVIAVLFTLGVFNASNFSSTACIAVSGFICASPAMNTSGYLSVTVGQIVNSSIKITGIDCTGTQGTPTFQGTSINLSAESTTPIVFHCPLASQTLGGYFTGYLWLQYMANGQTLQEQIATVTVSATTSGPLAPPPPPPRFLYISTYGSPAGQVVVVNPSNNQVVNTLTLPNGYEAFGLVQSANGKSLYAVYSGGQIYVLNSTSGAVENTVYNVAPCIRSLSYATNGLAIYGFAISCTNADGQLIDTATNTSGTPYPLPALPGDPTASYNQAALPADNDSIVFLAPYASNAVIVNPSNGALIAAPEACYPSQCSLVAAAPNGLNGYFTASDSSAYLYVVSAPSYGVSQQISLDANIPDSFAIYSTNPYGIGINPNSSDVYVSFGFLESGYPTQYALQTVSTSTYTVANTMLFSSPIRGPFAVSPNGKYLYAYSSSQSQYDVIALNNYTIVANIPMPGTPEAIAT